MNVRSDIPNRPGSLIFIAPHHIRGTGAGCRNPKCILTAPVVDHFEMGNVFAEFPHRCLPWGITKRT